MRDEIRIATIGLQDKGKHAGIGAGMLGGAGVVALNGAGALTAADHPAARVVPQLKPPAVAGPRTPGRVR